MLSQHPTSSSTLPCQSGPALAHSIECNTREGHREPQDTAQRSDMLNAGPLSGWLMQAWAEEPTFRSLEQPTPKARMPCLALRCDENGQCSVRMFRGVQQGAEATIKAGSHSFVQVPGEDFIRASKHAFPFGKASGHGVLSDEQPMLFAGEIEINENGQLTRWNNISGTYRFPAQYARQAELPLDAFWGLVNSAEVPNAAQDSPIWRGLDGGLWLHKSEGIALPEQVSN
jgi:hypothetical protein